MKVQCNKGITLLLAVLVGSLALSIAIGVFAIFFREIRITRGLLPSFASFYAADAGLECGFYLHFIQNVFIPAQPATFPVVCGGGSINVTHTVDSLTGYNFFDFQYNLASNFCVTVRVTRNTSGSCYKFDSFGVNKICGSVSSGTVVERGLDFRSPSNCLL